MKKEIEIDLNSKDAFVSDYSDHTLDPELRDFVLNELVGYDENIEVEFKVKAKYKITEEEKKSYVEIFRKEFKENLYDLEYFRKRSNKRKIMLLICGLVFLFLQFTLNVSKFFEEILNIIGCVCIWEVVYSLLFTEIIRERDIKRHKQIIKAKIEFID